MLVKFVKQLAFAKPSADNGKFGLSRKADV
ncbi:hypothetical protein LMG26411_04685 [Cupriavidus numazuensis]|uniref:Uncharacterized protein n=1 Tax=Cupriavidus numazuensis TaxID=221992 RepID=A0ABN7Q2H6_9BURK|nr:hypothetical protein LMG26411_04685 [Cupriavidus numazuensis]